MPSTLYPDPPAPPPAPALPPALPAHVVAMRVQPRGEWQPLCLCGWRVAPCADLAGALAWRGRHLYFSTDPDLVPFTGTCDGLDEPGNVL